MKVIYIVQRVGPYHEARFIETSKYLEANKINFSVLEISKSDSIYNWDLIKHSDEAIYQRVTLFNDNYDKINLLRLKIKLIKALNELKPDVLFIPGWGSKEAKLSLIWAKVNNVKTIVMSDSSEFDFERNRLKEFVKKNIVKQFNGAFVAGTSHLKYMVKLGMDETKITHGYDVVDNNYFKDNRTCEYNPDGYILASGRFIERKNFVLLIEAYFLYRQKITSPKKLVICGSGELLNDLIDKIKELNLMEFIELPGFIQYRDLPKFYSNASVFIIPSTSEQWGLVINEAMASNLPILCSNRCGAHLDLVTPYNGYVFDPFNINDITNALVKFDMLSKKQKKDYSNESSKLIVKWSTKTFSMNFLKVIRKIGIE